MTKLNEHMHMNMITVNKYMHKNRNMHVLKTLGVGIAFKSSINPHRTTSMGLSPQSYPHRLILDGDTFPRKSNKPSRQIFRHLLAINMTILPSRSP